MGQGIGEVLTYAIAVSISLLSVIAVILMLFSSWARVNGPAFLVGWMGTLAVVSTVVYVVSEQSNAATSSSASDTIAWGKIVFGILLLVLAARDWRKRPEPGVAPARDAEVDGECRHTLAGQGVRVRGAHGGCEPQESDPHGRGGNGPRGARTLSGPRDGPLIVSGQPIDTVVRDLHVGFFGS